MSHEALHEPASELKPATLDMHRAIVSLIEELEAVDWYQQRVDAACDAELRAVLGHNRDEEIEHACMTLEWIRRRSEAFDRELRRSLFRRGPIVSDESVRDEASPAPESARQASGRLPVEVIG